MPADPASSSPKVPGSGVGVSREAENVPLTKRRAGVPLSSRAGSKLRLQLPVGSSIRNAENVGPDPANPIAIGFKPPDASKNGGYPMFSSKSALRRRRREPPS